MKLSDYKTATSTKVLLLGESGSGKSGSLASLASAGYNLRIIDLERGLDILANALRDWKKTSYDKDSINRVDCLSLVDGRSKDGKLSPINADAWQKTKDAFYGWKSEGVDYGPVTSWGDKDVFVIDTLGRLGKAALNYIMFINGELGKPVDGKRHIYPAQMLVDSFLQLLWDPAVSCNIVVLAHINFQEDDLGVLRGYPDAVGKALNPYVGRYFNTVLLAKTKTIGSGTEKIDKRFIITQSTAQIELKNTAPWRVKNEYPLETGLAEIFQSLRVQQGA